MSIWPPRIQVCSFHVTGIYGFVFNSENSTRALFRGRAIRVFHKNWPDWLQMRQIRDFFKSEFSTIWEKCGNICVIWPTPLARRDRTGLEIVALDAWQPCLEETAEMEMEALEELIVERGAEVWGPFLVVAPLGQVWDNDTALLSPPVHKYPHIWLIRVHWLISQHSIGRKSLSVQPTQMSAGKSFVRRNTAGVEERGAHHKFSQIGPKWEKSGTF